MSSVETHNDPFRAFFMTSPEMLLIAGTDGTIHHANAALEQMLGSSATGRSFADLFSPEDSGTIAAKWARVVASTEPVQFACRVSTPQADQKSIVCTARRLPESAGVCVVLRVQQEPPVNPAESLLKVLVDNLDIVVWAIDREGVFTYHDGKGLDRAGLQRGEHLGKNVFEIYAHAEEANSYVRRALAGEPAHSIAGAHDLFWETWFLPLRDARGEVASVAGVTLDISESKRKEKDLLAQIELIRKQQQMIRDLRTPIIEVWDRVLTLPIMGAIDRERAAEMMESLLAAVVRTGARHAILDFTGVDFVDSDTAAHLVALIRAVQLLGAEGIITGIRPSVAQTMVALGLDLGGIKTLANLREGLKLCMQKIPGRAM